jgi:type II secretory pathway component PulF
LILSYVPFLKDLNRKINLENFSSSLSLMLASGLDVYIALEQSAIGAVDPQIVDATTRVRRSLKKGQTLQQAFQAERIFGENIIQAITLGAESGKLPEFLKRSSETLKAEIKILVEKWARIVPVVMYWLIACYVIWTIVMFYVGHLNQINQVLIDT